MFKNIYLCLFICLAGLIFFTKLEDKEKGVLWATEIKPPQRSALIEEYHFPSILSREEILASLPKPVFPEDKIFFFPDPLLGLGSSVKIFRAFVVEVQDGGIEKRYRTFASTVGEFLDEQGIELGESDKLSPSRETLIEDHQRVKIIRVEETQIELKKKIPKEVVYREDPNLEKGLQKVLEEGSDGLKKQLFLLRRENGVEVSRKLVKEEVEKPMTPKVVLKGIKLPFISSGTATWYYAPSMTAAHKTLPKGSIVVVTNLENQKSVKVTITDWGPVGAEIDLSKDAFETIAPLSAGKIKVKIEKWLP